MKESPVQPSSVQNEPASQQPVDSPLPEKPPRFTKKVKIIIAVVVVIGIFLIAGVVGAYWYSNSSQTPAIENASDKTSTPTPTPDPTADWETYVNKTHKYSIKYPVDWIAYEAGHGQGDVEPISIDPANEEGVPGLGVGLIVRVDSLSSGCIGDMPIQIGGIGGFKQKRNISGETVEGLGEIGEVIPSKKFAYVVIEACAIDENKVFTFSFVDKDFSKEKIIDQILSTFKFTDSITDETADWKTYTGNGFSFKYPNTWKTTESFDPQFSPNLKLNLGLIPIGKEKGQAVPPITFGQLDNSKNLSFQEWDVQRNESLNLRTYLNNENTKTYIVPNLTAFVNEKEHCEPFECEQVIIMGDSNVFIVERFNLESDGFITEYIYTAEEIESYKPIFHQILSTFKFTDSNNN